VCNTEQIGAESRAIIEKTKKTVNQIKRAEETEWPCDGSVLGSYNRHPKGLVGADERTIHAKPRTD
jgi:hypothetical protein